MDYAKKSSNSSLSIHYSSGGGMYRSYGYGRGTGGTYVRYGYPAYPSHSIHRPGHPSHPIHRPGHPSYPVYRTPRYVRVVPYGVVEGVHFGGGGGVQVFPAAGGVQAFPAAGGGPVAEVVGDPSQYAHLSAAQAVDRGDELFARGDYAAATDAYSVAANKAPNDPMAIFALGHGLFAVGALDDAAAALRRAVALHPDIVRVRMRRRDFYGRPEDYDDQMARLLRHSAARPADKAATFLLGYNFFFSGEPALAKGQFALLGAGDGTARIFLNALARGQ